jgi:hypothetical protein
MHPLPPLLQGLSHEIIFFPCAYIAKQELQLFFFHRLLRFFTHIIFSIYVSVSFSGLCWAQRREGISTDRPGKTTGAKKVENKYKKQIHQKTAEQDLFSYLACQLIPASNFQLNFSI